MADEPPSDSAMVPQCERGLPCRCGYADDVCPYRLPSAMGRSAEGRDSYVAEVLSFTCPRCGAVSYHPTDRAEGYCARCHDYTGDRTPPFNSEHYELCTDPDCPVAYAYRSPFPEVDHWHYAGQPALEPSRWADL